MNYGAKLRSSILTNSFRMMSAKVKHQEQMPAMVPETTNFKKSELNRLQMGRGP